MPKHPTSLPPHLPAVRISRACTVSCADTTTCIPDLQTRQLRSQDIQLSLHSFSGLNIHHGSGLRPLRRPRPLRLSR